MNTDFFPQAKSPSIPKLPWVGARVLAPYDSHGSDRATATPSVAPAAIELNRIDHSRIDWDKQTANPEAAGASPLTASAMSRGHMAALGWAAALVAPLVASSLAQSAPSESVIEQSGGPLPSIGALKSEYLRCERISSQRRLPLHGMAVCNAVSDQLLKREFGGDLDLLLAWWRGELQASATGLGR